MWCTCCEVGGCAGAEVLTDGRVGVLGVAAGSRVSVCVGRAYEFPRAAGEFPCGAPAVRCVCVPVLR